MTIQQLIDTATRNQVFLEGLKTQSVRDFNKVFDDIDALTKSTLQALGVDKLSDMQRIQFENMLTQLRTAHLELLNESVDHSLEHMAAVAKFETEFEAKSLKSVMTPEGRQQVKDSIPGKAYQEALERPVQATGQLLEPLVRDFAERAVDTINNKVRTGYDQGRTTQQIIRDVIGTPNLRNKDGVTDVTRRQAATVVRTSLQHVANTARQVTWEENSDLVLGVVWVSTLDGRTTAQCRSLDHHHFKLDEGPRPPIHPNCRSTTAPDLDPAFDFLDEGATRSSEGGYVDQKTTYYDWLQQQDAAYQDEVLGKTRGKLFRDGGLTTQQFSDLQLDKSWKPITLEQMRQIEPLAFQRAGLTGSTTIEELSGFSGSVGLPGRPKDGTKGSQVWDLADTFTKDNSRTPTRQELLDLGRQAGLTDSTIGQHFSLWRTATDKARGLVPPPVDDAANNKAVNIAIDHITPPAPETRVKTGQEKWDDIKTAIDGYMSAGPKALSGHAVDNDNLKAYSDALTRYYDKAGNADGTINIFGLTHEELYNLGNYLKEYKDLSGVDFVIAEHRLESPKIAIHKLLETVNAPEKHLPVTASTSLTAQNIKDAQDAQDWLSRVVADKYKTPVTVDIAANGPSIVGAYYNRPTLSAYISADTPTKIVVHELAHHIEYEGGQTMRDNFASWLATRQGNGVRYQYTTQAGYEDCKVFDDEFVKRGGTAYTSRLYYDGTRVSATEVLSTGAERLFADPVDFYRRDPEHFELTVRALMDL